MPFFAVQSNASCTYFGRKDVNFAELTNDLTLASGVGEV